MLESKLDQKLIGYITTIENLTSARVKDVFLFDGLLLVVVHKGEAGKAIGKRGMNIKRISRLLRKKIKIIELGDDVVDFVKNFIDPLKADLIEANGKMVVLNAKDTFVKGKLIGRNRKNLELLNGLVRKYFNCEVAVK